MNIYILTSDKTNHLIKGMQYCIKKFWYHTPNVKILGYKNLDFELDSNFEFISLGKDKGPDHVNLDLLNFFKEINDKHFIFSVDDFFPIRHINHNIINIFEELITKQNISRIALNGHVKTKPYDVISKHEDFDIIELSQLADYRKSAVWSIWSKEYFIKYLNNSSNLWEWELDESCKNDNHRILGSIRSYAIQACHLMKRGKLKSDWYKDSEGSDIMYYDDMNKLKSIISYE